MIVEYSNGEAFIKENSSFLNENRYLSAFFYIDAPLLTKCDKKNYVFKVSSNNKTLLALKVEPYNLLLYGEKECLEELLLFLKNNNFEVDGVNCSTIIGDALLAVSEKILGKTYKLLIGMDFMEAKEISEESSEDVIVPTTDDVKEIYQCMINFFNDCGLPDKPNMEKIRDTISSFRIIRMDNKIVSLSKKSPDTDVSIRVVTVYTRPEYRNRGLARKVVNYVKNEIINEGKIATLNVDQANPVSYHLYTSLGFKKVLSQGVYIVNKTTSD